jgi:hypothetical protein
MLSLGLTTDELLGIGGRRGESGDRDRRGVGGHDCVRLQERAEQGENLALDLLVLRGRLDDEVATPERVERAFCR